MIHVNGERGPHLAKSWKQVGLCKGFTGFNCSNFQNEKTGNIKEAQISTIICSEEIEKGNKQDQASQISPSETPTPSPSVYSLLHPTFSLSSLLLSPSLFHSLQVHTHRDTTTHAYLNTHLL